MHLFATNPKFDRHMSPVGGLEGGGEVHRFTAVRHGRDAIAQCARPLPPFLGGVGGGRYDEMGNDANAEADAVLMSTASISAKHPDRTVSTLLLR